MNILILSCNTGEGHNAAGRAVLEQLEQRGAHGVLVDALSFASRGISRLVCDIHTSAYRNAPAIFDAGYDRSERPAESGDSIAYRANALYAKKLLRYIRAGGFDAVVAPHVFPAEALTCLRRQGLLSLPCCFIATDYTCSPFVGETVLDGYCIPHASLAEEFCGHGLPREKLIATGIPVATSFAAHAPRAEARRALSLPRDGRVILLMAGSMGAGHIGEVAARLLPQLTVDDRLICVCGNNEKLRHSLLGEHRVDPRVVVMGFTDRMSLLMDAADLLLTKAGGLTSTEAAVKGVPLVLMDVVGGCESRNIAFFTAHGLARAAQAPADIADLALSLLDDPAACAAMTARQRETIAPDAAAAVADWVLSAAAAGGEAEGAAQMG